MKPHVTLGTAQTPDGAVMTLVSQGDGLVIRVGGQPLMHSRQHGSEEAMAAAGCAHLGRRPRPRVLVGGLGMGYTLRATLELLPPTASIVVAELIPAVVEWNRGPLGHLAAFPLQDPRVDVREQDVAQVLVQERGKLDAVLLDVDNGPGGLTTSENDQLYGKQGIARCWQALASGGVLVVWSAHPDPGYAKRLEQAGFAVQVQTVRAGGPSGKGARHLLFVAERLG